LIGLLVWLINIIDIMFETSHSGGNKTKCTFHGSSWNEMEKKL